MIRRAQMLDFFFSMANVSTTRYMFQIAFTFTDCFPSYSCRPTKLTCIYSESFFSALMTSTGLKLKYLHLKSYLSSWTNNRRISDFRVRACQDYRASERTILRRSVRKEKANAELDNWTTECFYAIRPSDGCIPKFYGPKKRSSVDQSVGLTAVAPKYRLERTRCSSSHVGTFRSSERKRASSSVRTRTQRPINKH